jgi:hypothetical protein
VNAILLIVKWCKPLYKVAERQALGAALLEIEKIDDIPHWLTATDPGEVNRALHLLLEKITVSTETIELTFK